MRNGFILIDNYDSFTFNLVQYFGALGEDTEVIRNDTLPAADIIAKAPRAIVLSPGPCSPNEAGICLDLIGLAAQVKIPLLGVCLGHQALGQAMGGKVIRAPQPLHGKTSDITHTDTDLFKGLPQDLTVTRYHSLIVERDSLPADLTVTAETDDGLIMGLAHKTLPLYGVQFHPESIATQNGMDMLRNFINLSER
jgi:anthranilate synthase component 2